MAKITVVGSANIDLVVTAAGAEYVAGFTVDAVYTKGQVMRSMGPSRWRCLNGSPWHRL